MKTIGGTDGMHLKPDSHPFQSGGGRTLRPKMGSGAGGHPNPGGAAPKFVTANAEMRRKKPLNGPGTA